jgi:3-hydroxybutyrate dehydrogenase
MDGLSGRHALVTGGGRGIGRAVAAALTAAGARVTVSGRNEAPLRDTVAAGDAAGFFTADVINVDALREGIERATADCGPVDMLIANAGGVESAPFTKSDADTFRRMIDLNLMGTVNAMRAVVGGMSARRFGRIVAVASTAGVKGYAYVSAYCAAKHAVVGLVRSVALEVAKSGVTVNAVCPGFTDTELMRESIARIVEKTGRSEQAAREEFTRQNPLGRLIAPEEVAATVAFLCSSAASGITGATVMVAGGEV